MRCKNAELLHKIGVPKIDDFMEVTFSLKSDLNKAELKGDENSWLYYQ